MLPARFEIFYPLGDRKDQHHCKNGHRTETLEGERHNDVFIP